MPEFKFAIGELVGFPVNEHCKGVVIEQVSRNCTAGEQLFYLVGFSDIFSKVGQRGEFHEVELQPYEEKK